MRSFKARLAASHDFGYNERGSKLWDNHCVEECEREALAAIKQWKARAENPLKSAFQALLILLGPYTAVFGTKPADV